MAADKVSRAANVSTANNTSQRQGSQSREPVAAVTRQAPATPTRDGFAGRGPSPEVRLERELTGLFHMIEANNKRIREAAGRLRAEQAPPVPSVLGMTVAQAVTILSQAGYPVSGISYRGRPATDSVVVEQQPGPGAEPGEGGGVALLVGDPPQGG